MTWRKTKGRNYKGWGLKHGRNSNRTRGTGCTGWLATHQCGPSRNWKGKPHLTHVLREHSPMPTRSHKHVQKQRQRWTRSQIGDATLTGREQCPKIGKSPTGVHPRELTSEKAIYVNTPVNTCVYNVNPKLAAESVQTTDNTVNTEEQLVNSK